MDQRKWSAYHRSWIRHVLEFKHLPDCVACKFYVPLRCSGEMEWLCSYIIGIKIMRREASAARPKRITFVPSHVPQERSTNSSTRFNSSTEFINYMSLKIGKWTSLYSSLFSLMPYSPVPRAFCLRLQTWKQITKLHPTPQSLWESRITW